MTEDQEAQPLRQLGDYRIIREAGRGGMGVVYEAEQVSLGRHVALKVLPSSMLPDSKHILRFEREARSAAKLHHTNIVPVFGVGRQDGMHYYVMQFIRGLPLDDVIKELKKIRALPTGEMTSPISRIEQENLPSAIAPTDIAPISAEVHTPRTVTFTGDSAHAADSDSDFTLDSDAASESRPAPADAMPARPSGSGSSSDVISLPGQSGAHSDSRRRGFTYWESVAHIGQQVADAMQYAHEQGILHRDIKPSNLMLDMTGTTWVTDFGLAKATDQQDITHTGDIMGTLRYMPPEAFEGKTDGRSDIYSLGLTLYELLSFQPAYDEEDHRQLIRRVTAEAAPRLEKRNPSIPRDLVTVVHKAIDRDPARRYQTSRELGEDLQRFLHDEPIKARRVSSLERFARWSRRNKGLATALSAVASLVVIIAVGSAIAAGYFQGLSDKLQGTVTNLEQTQDSLEVSRDEAMGQAAANRRLANERAILIEQKDRQLYASDSSNVSYAARSADQHARLRAYVDRWAEQGSDQRDWEYYYLNSQICNHSLQFDHTIHGGGYTHGFSVDWCPQGRYIVMGDAMGCVRILDVFLERTASVAKISPRNMDVLSIDWSSDGAYVAAGGNDGNITVLAVGSSVFERELFQVAAHAKVRQLAWNADATRLVTCGEKDVKLWDRSGELLWEKMHSKVVIGVAWDSQGDRIAVGGAGGDLTIWDAESGDLVSESAFGARITACAWTADIDRVALATGQDEVAIWDLGSKSVVRRLHDDRCTEVAKMAWSPNGRMLATIGGGTRMLWDIETGNQMDRTAQVAMRSLAWGPDGGNIVSVGYKEAVAVWSPQTTTRPRQLPGAEQFQWSPRGSCIATRHGRRIDVWDAIRWEKVRTFSDHEGNLTAFSISPDEQWIATADDAANLYIWDLETGEKIHQMSDLPAELLEIAFSPDQRWLSGADKTGGPYPGHAKLYVWETESWRKRDIATVFLGWQRWSPDSRYLLSGARDFTWGGEQPSYGVWDVEFQQWKNLPKYMIDPFDAAWDPDGTRVALVHTRTNIEIRAPFSGTGNLVRGAHGRDIRSLDWSPTGRRLVSVGSENRARIWDVETRQQVHEIENALDAQWGPFGIRLAVLTPQGVELYDATAGAADGHWKPLVALLDRQRDLGQSTRPSLRATVEMHAQRGEWEDALDALSTLLLRDDRHLLDERMAADVLSRYVNAGAAKGGRDESPDFVNLVREVPPDVWTSEQRANLAAANPRAADAIGADSEERED